ncbi:4-(cytidine 5'-diphospho)-2-C-methyl-D-erythritol kinase [Gymnodinialimonas sp. 2305UL16-5]|uniref:4-(cytidine 5'-diphospho)-2-C-methyl-D-erythritol kinase n=1 Tax=Gymnodinialimonas mytili TaxID=3126503 RepID=UPI00309FC65A
MTERHFAPAKVNLALHVTGCRDDGYHLLDSIVVFAGMGDWLSVAPAPQMALRVTGPRASGVPEDERNLAWQAAEWAGRQAKIVLEKHLPHAGGIGGGSSDAAAVLRALGTNGVGAEAIGADVPVCLRGRPCRMSGIGDVLADVPPIPSLWIALVNPGVEVPTGAVFAALDRVDGSPLPEPDWGMDFIGWLSQTRNDLELPAQKLQPVIGDVLERLRGTRGCLFAHMSGSGATCFGLFGDEPSARAAVAAMPSRWWAEATEILP